MYWKYEMETTLKYFEIRKEMQKIKFATKAFTHIPNKLSGKRINQKCFQQLWEKFSFYFDKASSLGEKQINDSEFFYVRLNEVLFPGAHFDVASSFLCVRNYILKCFCMSDFSVTVTVVIKKSLPFQDFVISRWLFQQPVKTTLKNVSIFIKFKSGFLYESLEILLQMFCIGRRILDLY